MTTDESEKLDLHSQDVAEQRRQALLRLYPEIHTEAGKLDIEKLKLALGEAADVGKERFGLNWPGKADCFRTIQAPSLGTLRPCPEESVNFDSTGHLIIEGDNLEVLKLLQKPYLGNVKMIYIDPPYNTGNDFIYPDDYTESLRTYLEYTGQADAGGKPFRSNTDTDGRFHSRWLNMMYPRLYLARDLLREDGVIFVSCDDHEVHNLRALMNEVFGEENFVACVIWQKVYSPKNSARHLSEDHDYIVVYARHAEIWRPRLLPRTAEMEARYDNPDQDPRGPWKPSDLSARNYYSEGTYAIQCPSGRTIAGPPTGSYWRVKKSRFLELDQDGRIWWGEDGNNVPAIKRFRTEVKQGRIPQTLWPYSEVGHTQVAKKQLLEHVAFEHTDNVLDTVKPTGLIRRMLQIATQPTECDVILDFFAGSGPTGHAVLEQNRDDGGNRTFLLVQLPEPLPTPEARLRTIADIAKERLRHAAQALTDGDSGKLALEGSTKVDRGFRVFKLAESNFATWDAEQSKDADQLAEQLALHANHIRDGRSELDLLYEILLKSGYPLASPVEALELAGKRVNSVGSGELLICLERTLTLDLIRVMAARTPKRVVCLEEGFAGNDQLKANAVYIFKTKGITSFKTV
ncbi:site-specific DNA-methyltransferase [bacterium]|nr:site-specific DNA-methyltransferase [bacterium]